MEQLSPPTLETARSVDEVLGAVRTFLGDLTSKGLDRLPRYNRPVNVDSALGVELWAEQLARYEAPPSQDPVNSALFVEVRDYFARAAARLSDIGRADAGGG